MISLKNFFLIFIFFLTVLASICNGQESYLIKKKAINENIIIKNNDESKNSKEPLPKSNKDGKAKIISKKNKKIDKQIKNLENEIVVIEKNKFRIIYEPNQRNLTEKALIKVLEISNQLNKESLVTIKSYASKNQRKGSSDARRLSLSRALEVRTLFIENEFPATNIIVKALGTQENKEGYKDILIIAVN